MKHRMLGLFAALTLLGINGCSGDCVSPTGTYDVTLIEVTGDCGDLGITELGVAGSSMAPAGCTRRQLIDSDGCSVSLDMTCGTGTADLTINVDYAVSADGTAIEGTYDYVARDSSTSALICSSLYDFTGTQQP